MKTIMMILVTGSLGVACGQNVAPEFPHTFATESQDEWLETHCIARGVIDTNTAAFNEAMKNANANFAEIIRYYTGNVGPNQISIKAYACAVRPTWYGADSLDKPEDL